MTSIDNLRFSLGGNQNRGRAPLYPIITHFPDGSTKWCSEIKLTNLLLNIKKCESVNGRYRYESWFTGTEGNTGQLFRILDEVSKLVRSIDHDAKMWNIFTMLNDDFLPVSWGKITVWPTTSVIVNGKRTVISQLDDRLERNRVRCDLVVSVDSVNLEGKQYSININVRLMYIHQFVHKTSCLGPPPEIDSTD